MRLWWNHLWKSRNYRQASADERRLIELRFSVANGLKRRRRQCRLTQAALGARILTTRNTISRLERASNRVSLDHAIRALIALGCSDSEISDIFNPQLNPGILMLRKRASERGFPKPAAQTEKSTREHRFHNIRCGRR